MYNINGGILLFIIEILFYQIAKFLLPKFKSTFKGMWLKNQLIKY